ncbi:MAG: hypothetical protein HQM08_11995 [Candidatus Riflebacteria bacterium]|nr:hypothetical protein [Candidatus Riflebacteria bacterium]
MMNNMVTSILFIVFFIFLLPFHSQAANLASNSTDPSLDSDFMQSSKESGLSSANTPPSEKVMAPNASIPATKPSVKNIESQQVEEQYGMPVPPTKMVLPMAPRTLSPPNGISEVTESGIVYLPEYDIKYSSILLIRDKITQYANGEVSRPPVSSKPVSTQITPTPISRPVDTSTNTSPSNPGAVSSTTATSSVSPGAIGKPVQTLPATTTSSIATASPGSISKPVQTSGSTNTASTVSPGASTGSPGQTPAASQTTSILPDNGSATSTIGNPVQNPSTPITSTTVSSVDTSSTVQNQTSSASTTSSVASGS